jgi:predicted flavoprotein YhiN
MMATDIDVVVIGAGAAGLMCASTAGKRGRRVLLVDHATKLAEKIRISGGGRCNFTNLYTAPEAFLSANPHFCKSALRQYDQHDFIALVDRHKIAYHEKNLASFFAMIRRKKLLTCWLLNARRPVLICKWVVKSTMLISAKTAFISPLI